MIGKIRRGDRMGGLLKYLVGEGKANEHENPHVVAGDIGLMAFEPGGELSEADAARIAAYLDEPRKAFGTKVRSGVYEWSEEQGKKVRTGFKDSHVWHLPVAIPPEDGVLSDEKWQQIASELVEAMDFAGPGKGSEGVRWAAIRHGVSAKGNDHIHVVVSMVREDGSRAYENYDQRRVQKVMADLEQRHGLTVIASRHERRGAIGLEPGELRREGEAPRRRMGRIVRAAAVASKNEAEFVRAVKSEGLNVWPRYAKGGRDEVEGYSVSEPGGDGIKYGGGRLARDLSLARLREGWDDTPENRAEALAEWSTSTPGERGPMSRGARLTQAQRAAAELAELRARLAAVPAGDRDAWAQVAGETAGAFAAWSRRTEVTPGPLARTADLLSECAQTHRRGAGRRPAGASRAAMVFLAMGPGGDKVAEALLMIHLLNAMKALHDAARAVNDLRTAARIETAVRRDLAPVAAELPDVRGMDADQVAAVALAPETGGRSTPEAAPTSRPRGPQGHGRGDDPRAVNGEEQGR